MAHLVGVVGEGGVVVEDIKGDGVEGLLHGEEGCVVPPPHRCAHRTGEP